MIVGPAFEKYQHAKAAAFERANLRKIEYKNSQVFERRHRSTELERSFAPHDSSYALNNPEFSDSFNPQVQHCRPPPSCIPDARVLPSGSRQSLYPLETERQDREEL